MGREYEPWASSPAARAVRVSNRRRDTRPELAVRRAVHALGLRYRVDVRPLPTVNRRADLVFSRRRVAVFVDGCYWHGCPDHGTTPKTNAIYWGGKIARNSERDRDTDAHYATPVGLYCGSGSIRIRWRPPKRLRPSFVPDEHRGRDLLERLARFKPLPVRRRAGSGGP